VVGKRLRLIAGAAVCSAVLVGGGLSAIAEGAQPGGQPTRPVPSATARQPQRPAAPKPRRTAPPNQDGELATIMARLGSQRPGDKVSAGPAGPGASSATPKASKPLAMSPPVSDSVLADLQEKIHRVLTIYFPKHQNTRDNSAWEVMHEIIAFGVDSQLYREGPTGPKVNAIGWLCYNGSCKGEQMLYLDRGKLVARKGPGVQGHFGQFLAILAQSRLPIDYPMLVGGKTFKISDLVEHEKMDCQPGEELTFKLIGLMHYLDSDETWTTRYGDQWSVSRLITEELKQPIRGAACGGTHRLMGFSYSVNKRIQRGKPVTGEFLRAQNFINDYHRYTFSLQNPDGSFSTQWFTRGEASPDVDRRLKTTGHISEWLSFSLSDDEVRSPAMVKAVDYLATILLADRNRSWEIGPVGHGLHALAVYDRRLAAAMQPPLPLEEPVAEATPDSQSDETALEYLPVDVVADVLVAGVPRLACPAGTTALEIANKPHWGMPECEIGNENESSLVAPDADRPMGDDDDSHCL
jgi:hypothetical protein